MITGVQAKIKELSVQLEEAYTHRTQLWINFEKALDQIGDAFPRFCSLFSCLILTGVLPDTFSSEVEPTMESLKAFPGKIERRIANLDKQTKGLEKNDDEAASAARKKLKALLSKLS